MKDLIPVIILYSLIAIALTILFILCIKHEEKRKEKKFKELIKQMKEEEKNKEG